MGVFLAGSGLFAQLLTSLGHLLNTEQGREGSYIDSTGLRYKAGLRLHECCKQVEAEKVSNSRKKVHQTWGLPYT